MLPPSLLLRACFRSKRRIVGESNLQHRRGKLVFAGVPRTVEAQRYSVYVATRSSIILVGTATAVLRCTSSTHSYLAY